MTHDAKGASNVQQRACDRCTQGVMDSTNPHLRGECSCPCHVVEQQATHIEYVEEQAIATNEQAKAMLADRDAFIERIREWAEAAAATEYVTRYPDGDSGWSPAKHERTICGREVLGLLKDAP